jgi:hypothetical protein
MLVSPDGCSTRPGCRKSNEGLLVSSGSPVTDYRLARAKKVVEQLR